MSENVKSAQNYARIYNGVMILIYLLSMICIVPLFLLDPEIEFAGALFMISCVSIFILPFFAFHAYLAFSVNKKSKFIYYGNIISFALGVSSLLTIVPAVLLIIKWVEPEIKEYYIES